MGAEQFACFLMYATYLSLCDACIAVVTVIIHVPLAERLGLMYICVVRIGHNCVKILHKYIKVTEYETRDMYIY